MSGKGSKSKISPRGKEISSKNKSEKLGKGSPKVKENEVYELTDTSLGLPELTTIEVTRDLPRYTSVVARPEASCPGLEDIDIIQLELEVLLKSAVRREYTLANEEESLVALDAVDRKRRASPGFPLSPGRRGKGTDEKPAKKIKDNSGKPKDVILSPPSLPKTRVKPGEQFDSLPPLVLGPPPAPPAPPGPPASTPSPVAARNDIAVKYWASLDSHCADITEDAVQMLENQLKAYDEDSEYFKIPALGKHYALRWAHEDLFQQQKDGTKISGDAPSDSDAKILRRVEQQSSTSDDTPPFGPLAQRLVSALIEQNLVSSLDENMEAVPNKDMDSLSARKVMKALKITSPQAFEKRIKKELEEQGILDPNDDNDSDDEILTEIKSCQEELKALTQHNKKQLTNLHAIAQKQIRKQKLEAQLKQADIEVVETYRRLQGYLSKKRPPTKKEKELSWKCLHDRESIWQQLQSL